MINNIANRVYNMVPNSVKEILTKIEIRPKKQIITSHSIELIPLNYIFYTITDLPINHAFFHKLYNTVILCTPLGVEVWVVQPKLIAYRLYSFAAENVLKIKYIKQNRTEYDEGMLTLAYTKYNPNDYEQSSDTIVFHSMLTDKSYYSLQVEGSILNFKGNGSVVIIMLKNGIIKLFDLLHLTMLQSIETKYDYSNVKGFFPNYADISNTLYAYAYNEDASEKKIKQAVIDLIDNTTNSYPRITKTAKSIINYGEKGYNKVKELLQLKNANNISNNEPLKQSANMNFLQMNENKNYEHLVANGSKMAAVIIRRIVDNAFIASLIPPYCESIYNVQFSPSSRLLVASNDKCQSFYIYKLFPESNYRHKCRATERSAVLLYHLFRGYSHAIVNNISFTEDEKWMLLSNVKGTTHIYRLDINNISAKREIIFNTRSFNYKESEKISNMVCSLTAFIRIKHNTYLDQSNVSPISQFYGSYPVDKNTKNIELLHWRGLDPANYKSMSIPAIITINSFAELQAHFLYVFNTKNIEEKNLIKDEPVKIDFESLDGGELEEEESDNQILRFLVSNKHNYFDDTIECETAVKQALKINTLEKQNEEEGENLHTTNVYTLTDVRDTLANNEKIIIKDQKKEEEQGWFKYIEQDYYYNDQTALYNTSQCRLCIGNPQKYDDMNSPDFELDYKVYGKSLYCMELPAENVDYSEIQDNPFVEEDDMEVLKNVKEAMDTDIKPLIEKEEKPLTNMFGQFSINDNYAINNSTKTYIGEQPN